MIVLLNSEIILFMKGIWKEDSKILSINEIKWNRLKLFLVIINLVILISSLMTTFNKLFQYYMPYQHSNQSHNTQLCPNLYF